MADKIVFDTSVPCCVSGDNWGRYGGINYNGENNGGWDAIVAIFKYLDTLVTPEAGTPGSDILIVGSGNTGLKNFLASELGGARYVYNYADTIAVFDEMAAGTYWPRLIYFPGDRWQGWEWYPHARTAVYERVDFLRTWLWEKRSGLFSSCDVNAAPYGENWVTDLYSGMLKYINYEANYSMEPGGVAVTNPLLSSLIGDSHSGKPTLTVYWERGFAVPYSMRKRIVLDPAVIVWTVEDPGPRGWIRPPAPITILGMPESYANAMDPGPDARWFAR